MGLLVSPRVRRKMWTKHQVSVAEVEQCFANLRGRFLVDTRERHRTDPPTRWFLAPTDSGRVLKVVFIRTARGNVVKSAFKPNAAEKRLFVRYGRR